MERRGGIPTPAEVHLDVRLVAFPEVGLDGVQAEEVVLVDRVEPFSCRVVSFRFERERDGTDASEGEE